MGPEGLGKLKKKNPVVSSGIELAIFLACSILPQPTTLPRAPYVGYVALNVRVICE
jgi:hypothetical protein